MPKHISSYVRLYQSACNLQERALHYVVDMNVKPLSTLELEVMEIVWNCGDCCVRDVVGEIHKEKKLAYTTIATIMTRLVEKGALKKKRFGSSIIYSPKFTKQAVGRSVAQSFINRFCRSFGEMAIASFAESIDQLPASKKKYFLQLLNSYERKNK